MSELDENAELDARLARANSFKTKVLDRRNKGSLGIYGDRIPKGQFFTAGAAPNVPSNKETAVYFSSTDDRIFRLYVLGWADPYSGGVIIYTDLTAYAFFDYQPAEYVLLTDPLA